MNIPSAFGKLDSLLTKLGEFLKCPLLLIIRLYWGWQFFEAGKGKLMDLHKVTGYFQSLHIPAPGLNAVLAACTEAGCGLLLLVGLFSRFATLPLIFVMLVAYQTADPAALHAVFSNPDKFFGADEFLFLYAAVIIFVFGPGVISLDSLLLKKK